MAEKDINIVVKAKDDASDKLKAIGEKVSAGFDKISGAAGLAAGAIGAFSVLAIQGAAEAEEANKQLEHAVIEVSHATREQLAATSDLADELERKGVLDGDNIKVGLAQLSTFGLSNDAVQGLAGSMADLSVNQFGVNASGEQVAQSANMIAKALNGQFGALEKSGIRFTEAQQKMIQFGTEQEKVAAINEGFAQNLKYTNDVALTSFSGQMAHLNVQIGNVQEAIGAALIPAVQKLFEAVLPVVQQVAAWIGANPDLVAGILGVTTGVLGLIFVTPKVIAAFQAVGAAMTFLTTSPIAAIVVAVAALTAGFIYLWQTNEGFRNAITAIWNGILAFLRPVWKLISDGLAGFMGLIKAHWQEWEALVGILTIVWNTITGFIQTAWSLVVTTLQNGFGPALAMWEGFWSSMQAAVQKVVDAVLGIVGGMVEGVKRAVSTVGSALGSIAGTTNRIGAAFDLKQYFRAEGGPVSGGQPYIVGEKGPELFVPGSSGNIVSNRKLAGAAGGGDGVNIIVSGNTLLDSQAAVKIGDMIVNRLRLNRKLA